LLATNTVTFQLRVCGRASCGARKTIKAGCVGRVERWEREHKIKLYWNNWFDVSFAPSFELVSLALS